MGLLYHPKNIQLEYNVSLLSFILYLYIVSIGGKCVSLLNRNRVKEGNSIGNHQIFISTQLEFQFQLILFLPLSLGSHVRYS